MLWLMKENVLKNTIKICKNVTKTATSPRDNYTTGCLLDYLYFKENCKLIAKHQQWALDADPKAIKQINFIENIEKSENTKMLFILQEVKENILDFSQETVAALWIYFALT